MTLSPATEETVVSTFRTAMEPISGGMCGDGAVEWYVALGHLPPLASYRMLVRCLRYEGERLGVVYPKLPPVQHKWASVLDSGGDWVILWQDERGHA